MPSSPKELRFKEKEEKYDKKYEVEGYTQKEEKIIRYPEDEISDGDESPVYKKRKTMSSLQSARM